MGVIMHNNIPYGGGSTIEPNPQESATEQLETLGIDGDVYEIKDPNAAPNEPTFNEASTRENLNGSGETIATIFGKIKKFFSDLKTVAFTGAYSDLSGTPTIPTVNNGTLTIKQNNANLGTFTANQSTASNINIECALPSDVEGSKVATGNPLTIADSAGIKAEKIVIEFEPKQAGSGTPSPSNIRPITGYTSISANGCGKQLYSGSKTEGYYINNTGTKVSDQASAYSDPIFVDPSSYYTMSGICVEGNAGTKRLHAYDANGNWISMIASVKPTQSNAQFSLTGLTPSNCSYVVMSWYGRDAWATHDTNIQLEKGNQATTYEAYKGDSVLVQFGQTLYGGKLTILQDGSADVYCDTGYVDLGAQTYGTANNRFYVQVPVKVYTTDEKANMVCSCYETKSYTNQSNFTCSSYAGYLYFMDNRYSTPADFKTAMNDQQACYELATPFTIHLSPVETLTLLRGINNIWTDGTTLSLTYQPDNAIGQAKGTAQELVDSASTWKLFAESANANIALPTNCKELYICVIYTINSASDIMYDFHILPDIITKEVSYFRQGDYYTPDYFSRCTIRIRKTSSVYDTRVEHLYMNNTTDRAENTTVKVYYR